MKGLKHFKILLRYFKDNKLILSLYIIFTILKYFEPLANAFIWATAFQALATGDKSMFITYLMMWSGVIILAWVLIQLPTDLIYNKLEKNYQNLKIYISSLVDINLVMNYIMMKFLVLSL